MTTHLSSENDYEIGRVLEIPPGWGGRARSMKIVSKQKLQSGLFLYELEEV